MDDSPYKHSTASAEGRKTSKHVNSTVNLSELGLRVDGNLDASRGPNADDDSEDDCGYSIRGNRDAYFSETPREKLFYFTSGEFAHQDSAVDDNLGVSAGIGIGRVWSATPLAKALRIQESLQS